MHINATHKPVQPVPTPSIDRINLDLSVREFRALAALTSRCGGQPHGPRSVSQEIHNAACRLGLGDDLTKFIDMISNRNNAIYFVDEWPRGEGERT